MTSIGQKALVTYSLILVLVMFFRSIRELKEGDKGWGIVLYTPVLILLTNLL